MRFGIPKFSAFRILSQKSRISFLSKVTAKMVNLGLINLTSQIWRKVTIKHALLGPTWPRSFGFVFLEEFWDPRAAKCKRSLGDLGLRK